ncbi:hypothetical protein C0J52_02466 [Blattella germanica]|nr:hypothetical protein C0J52_02466 [Blattella germanica]
MKEILSREQHVTRETTQDWFGQSENFGPSIGLGLNEAKRFFREAREKFTSSTGTGPDLFSQFVKDNEQRFHLQCSSRASVGGFEQDGRDLFRSFSAGSGWGMSPQRSEEKSQTSFSQTSPQKKVANTDNKPFFGFGFPMFMVSNRRMWTESWSEKFSMSRSSYEYCSNVYRITSEQVSHCDSYDVSESESEDEDVEPHPLSIAASETSSLSTLESDIMKNFAPFLKLYTEYVKNFDNAMNIINALAAKNQRFAAIMDEIHRMPECGNLTLSHHMLSPIQRIPRYELLLKDYLKKLPDGTIEQEDTEKALHLVSTAANHANEAMKKIDKFKELLEVQEKISGAVDLVSPTRELIKEGKIVKISARSGDHQESDLLLLCSSGLLPNRVGISAAYRLRVKFLVENIQVLEGDNLETANTFYICDHSKNVELYTQTVEEKSSWLDALCLAIEELYKRKSSFKIGTECSSPVDLQKPPHYIKMDGVQKCMDCGANFNVMKRKHHCRACGLVVCGKCSNQKYPLPFEDNKPSRVCRPCHQQLMQQRSSSPDKNDSDAENITASFARGKGLLELRTNKSWVRRWFALHPDFVLYSFRSHKDQHAMTATPLPGYTIAKVLELKGESFSDKEKVFKMFHAKKMYYFQAESKEIVEK